MIYRRSAFGVHQKLLLIPFYLICIFNCLLVFFCIIAFSVIYFIVMRPCSYNLEVVCNRRTGDDDDKLTGRITESIPETGCSMSKEAIYRMM